MPATQISHAGGRSRTIAGALTALIGGVLLLVGVSIPAEEISQTVEMTITIIGGIMQLIGAIMALYARYSRGDVTITGKKVANTTVIVEPKR